MQIKAPYFKIESFGAVDGPGIRLVVFLQGCPLRCVYCHNPESWKLNGSNIFITTDEIMEKYQRNLPYYKNGGGITISGGEPLIHLDFIIELAKKCFEQKISLALDSSGANFSVETLSKYREIAKYCPLWIVDIKHINIEKHQQITGFKKQTELELINFLELNKQFFWIRQVLVPQLTDNNADLIKLGGYLKTLKYMTKFELLPYHNMAIAKYESLGIKYPLKLTPAPSSLEIDKAMKAIKLGLKN